MTLHFNRRAFGRIALGALAGASLPAAASATIDSNALLRRVDAIRLPQRPFSVDVTLTNFDNGRQTERTKVTTFSRRGGDGQFLSIVHINAPKIDRGKLLLRNGNILWLYDPASSSSVRISPRQRLLGNASNGDVISSNFVGDYHATVTGAETVADGDRVERQANRLELSATSGYAPYDSIELWTATDDDRPLKGKFYAASGELLKVAWYRDWRSAMGAVRPMELVIADGFNPRKVTVMSLGGYQARELPTSWFRREWLPRFQK